MLRTLAFTALLAAPGAAAAEGALPAFHGVAGVAADDALNLRSAPDPAAEVVGALGPDTTDVEVVAIAPAPSGAPWARVALPEGGGWAAARFLVRQDRPEPDAGWLPPLSCSGTEPFWSLDLGTGEIAGLAMDGRGPAPVFVTRRTRSANDTRSHGLTARWDGPDGDPATFGITGAPVTGVIRRAACSDGMSDRPYGLAVDLMVGTLGDGGRADIAHLSGCCRLAPPG